MEMYKHLLQSKEVIKVQDKGKINNEESTEGSV